jgi:uncharacterized protein
LFWRLFSVYRPHVKARIPAAHSTPDVYTRQNGKRHTGRSFIRDIQTASQACLNPSPLAQGRRHRTKGAVIPAHCRRHKMFTCRHRELKHMQRRLFVSLALAGLATPEAFACGDPDPIIHTDCATRRKKLIDAARAQIGVTRIYDPAYVQMKYPGGDVPREHGVCTDVVIRSYRDAMGIDLQQLVHDDMRKNFSAYPNHWGLEKPDRNIDHRRVPNLQMYLKRQGAQRAVSLVWPGVESGDVVTVKLPGNLDHIGIISDKTDETTNLPLAIHNIGRGTEEDETFFQFRLTGRYRFKV